jgi:hypothetical protein
VSAPTCWQHRALSAPQMPCRCRVGMTITRHVGGAMAFGGGCWAATEGSGDAGLRRQRRKMSNKGVNVDIVQQEGRLTRWDKQALTTRCNATTQQSNKAGVTRCVRGRDTTTRQDKTRQREDARTRGRNDPRTRRRNNNETRGTMRDATQRNDVAWHGNATGREVTTRGRETTQQPQTNKAGAT